MRWYKNSSPTVRNRSARLFLKHKKAGAIPQPGKCCKCAATPETAKRMDWHNEDYVKTDKLLTLVEEGKLTISDVFESVMSCVYPICSGCHRKVHTEWMKKVDYFNNPKYKDDPK